MLKHSGARRIMLSLLCIMAATGFSATQAPSAEAKADVCTAATNHITYWCAIVNGSGGRVTYVQAHGQILGKPKTAGDIGDKYRICNYRAEVRISGNGNQHFATYSNSSRPGECTYSRAWNYVQINREFPKGFYVCTKYFINHDQQQGREICIKLT